MLIYLYAYSHTAAEFECVGVVDDFVSFTTTQKMNDKSNFTLVMNGEAANTNRLRKAQIIATPKFQGVITWRKDSYDNNIHTYEVEGMEIKDLVFKRVIQGTYEKEAQPAAIVKDLIDKNIVEPEDTNRRVNLSCWGSAAADTQDEVEFESKNKNLGDELAKFAATHNIGWKAELKDRNAIVWDVYSGVDRTANQTENDRLIISYGFGTITNSSIEFNELMPSFCWAGDSTIGTYDTGAAGLFRSEIFKQETSTTSKTALEDKAKEAAEGEYSDSAVFDCALSPQAIKEYNMGRWGLGDKGTIIDDRLNEPMDIHITAIKENYAGNNKHSVSIVLGYDKNNLYSMLKRMGG